MYFDPGMLTPGGTVEIRPASRLQIQLPSGKQHRIANDFPFETPSIEPPQELVVRIDLRCLGLMRRRLLIGAGRA